MYNGKYNDKIKQKAKLLRKEKGLSYKEIADKIGISKSTAKLWCGDIVLKSEYKERLYTKKISALFKGPNSSHERRIKEIESIIKNGENEIGLPLGVETYKLAGAALYWAEGNKTKHFAITNSDPYLIKFMVTWLHDMLDVSPKNIKAHLNIYPQQNEKLLKIFWSELTKIPIENFGKSFVKPENKNYKKNTLYYGTIKIRVFRGTDLRHRVFGWVNTILKNSKIETDKVERKWHKLKTEYPR
ncbi:MAG: helix-turn-helix transcriptional regulator [Parcubacteria group bacterium]|jgi:transcriptional regulator with XRE-family HTH domain